MKSHLRVLTIAALTVMLVWNCLLTRAGVAAASDEFTSHLLPLKFDKGYVTFMDLRNGSSWECDRKACRFQERYPIEQIVEQPKK